MYDIGQPLFITFRLHGSLPVNRSFTAANVTSGEAFAAMDRLLDQARSGPTFLRQPAIAEVVVESIHIGAGLGHFDTHSWVVMPNHVHLLITPQIGVSRLLDSLKSATGRRANVLLNRTGQPFWQNESYDRLVRDDDEFRRLSRYIEHNPVKAGLVVNAEEFVFSSARRPERPPQPTGPPYIA